LELEASSNPGKAPMLEQAGERRTGPTEDSHPTQAPSSTHDPLQPVLLQCPAHVYHPRTPHGNTFSAQVFTQAVCRSTWTPQVTAGSKQDRERRHSQGSRWSKLVQSVTSEVTDCLSAVLAELSRSRTRTLVTPSESGNKTNPSCANTNHQHSWAAVPSSKDCVPQMRKIPNKREEKNQKKNLCGCI
jgi:hypothetical protein